VREVIVWETVHNVLWQVLDKALYEKVIDRLCDQLKNHYDRWRHRRDPDDATLFDYPLYVADESSWHTFRFSVDDTMTDDHLFVIGVSHQQGKVGI
jgi:hypothetical protein